MKPKTGHAATSTPTPNERRTSIRISRRYRAAPERVFAAWLDADFAGTWLFATASRPMSDVAIDAQVAGRFRFVGTGAGAAIEHTGEYLEIEPPRRLVFTLDDDATPGRVVVEIATVARGCGLTLTHEHIRAAAATALRARWTGILYGLGEALACADPAARRDR